MLAILLLALGCIVHASFWEYENVDEDLNQRPVIGVVSVPYAIPDVHAGSPEAILASTDYSSVTKTYIPGTYARWAEGAGARLVPLPYSLPKEELLYRLSGINGVLFTGGMEDFYVLDEEGNRVPDMYTTTAIRIFEFAMAENDAGRYFPIWGTCLGL
jgi:gamma-glutamyl hydrolase